MGISMAADFDGQVLEGASLPARLRDLPEPPDRLFLHGNLPNGPCIGVVGTRHPTLEALDFAENLSSSLAAHGVAIVSGGAKGIDAAAHRGALAAAGTTLVVAGSSLDHPFPAAHRGLYAEIIARGGGYLSRFDVDVPARRHHFLDRNGILVALCDALVLVEAPLKSGARNATAWARQLGRPCFVVPSTPWNERGRGCVLELQLGARALGGPLEILDWLAQRRRIAAAPELPLPPAESIRGAAPSRGASPASLAECPPSPSSAPPASPADDHEMKAAVLGALAAGARYADDVAHALDIDLPRANHALLLLMLSGDIQQGPGGVLTRAAR
jgi:DNA processing protein